MDRVLFNDKTKAKELLDLSMKQGIVFLAVCMALVSCLPEVNYPPEPVIAFQKLDTSSDPTKMYIDFTDGDGNIGLDQSDTLAPYCPDTCIYYYNLFLEYYELQSGAWTHIPLDPELGQIPFYYRIPRVEPSGQNPALNGEIKIDMPSYYLISNFDTCRFEIHLVDRAFNESNTVQSNTFVKPF